MWSYPGNVFANHRFGSFQIYGYTVIPYVQREIAWTLHRFATGQIEYPQHQDWDIIERDTPVELKGVYITLNFLGEEALKRLPTTKRRNPEYESAQMS